MKKLTLAIGLTMGMAVTSTPALAQPYFIVENNSSDYTLWAACGSLHAIAKHKERSFDCSGAPAPVIRIWPWGESDGEAAEHVHDCPDEAQPVHRIMVTETGAVVAGTPGMTFSHFCEESAL